MTTLSTTLLAGTVSASFTALAAAMAATLAAWRWWWFGRNPPRQAPVGEDLLSPADGIVVYVRRVESNEPVISIKAGLAASVDDIMREHVAEPKFLVGIFMSPFDVHYNRAPIGGVVESTKQYPAVGRNRLMAAMQLRTLFRRRPMYAGSPHIIQNNRAVTRFSGALGGRDAWCYVVQIGSRGISGIDVYPRAGDTVERGAVFGMIRIGSQVDLVAPARDGFEIAVREGQRVRAGESVLVRVTNPEPSPHA